MRGTFTIGRVLGIPILINPTWFASLLFIVWVLASQFFPSNYPGAPAAVYWSYGLVGGLIFFLSIVLHELGHCLVARHYAIPVKSITLFIFGGVSQITRDAPKARAEFLMAIAGPAVSVALGAVLVSLAQWILPGQGPAVLLCVWLGWMNLVLAVFNLLPGFPMDGGRVLRSLLWGITGNFPVATRLAAFLGRAMALLMIAAGVATVAGVRFGPIALDPSSGFWFILVGWFLNSAAGQTQRQTRVLNVLGSYRADQVMQADVPQISSDATLRSFIYELPNRPDEVAYFVTRDGRIAGLLPRERLGQVPPVRWNDVRAGDLMIPAEQIVPAEPGEDGATLLQRMDTQGLPGLPVVSGGSVTGLVTRVALFRLLRRNPKLRFSRL